MSLYLKYRPKTVSELDLLSVRESFEKIIKAKTVAHAYLFTGPRGAGKTSSARILARMINCEKSPAGGLGEPCNKCSSCQAIITGRSLDFVEIDAASNRGIDDIRELKEKIKLAPIDLKYKVYIIDEVHMLTMEAFNALLKTLEEPPKHAIFVLCTTETHKVPETIVSRCVRIKFGKATIEEMERALLRVVKGEGKEIDKDALVYLASNVDGSFRDGVKLLETVLSVNNKVDLAEIQKAVLGSSNFDLTKLSEALVKKDASTALAHLAAELNSGVNIGYLITSLMKILRDQVVVEGNYPLIKLIYKLDDVTRRVATSTVPELLLEVVIIDWCSEKEMTSSPDIPNSKKQPVEHGEATFKVAGHKVESLDLGHDELWNKLVTSLNGDSVTLGALLSKASPARLAGDELTIRVDYAFHRDQIMSEKVLSKLESILEKLIGREIRVVCEVAPSKSDDTIDEAIAIFS